MQRLVVSVLVAGAAIGRPNAARAQAQAQSPTVTVGGVIYAQYSYALKDTANHGNNFDVTRAYLNVLGKFAHGIQTRVTADIFRSTDGSLSYRLKYAYGAWTPDKSALTFKLGQIHTPFIDWEESLWDYRVQGQMALERGGYLSSSDFGLGIDGNWGSDKVNAQIGAYNGENYNKAPGDQGKDLMGRVSVRLVGSDEGGRTGGLRLTGYAHHGVPTGGGTRQRYVGMVSWRSKVLTLAGEFGATKDSTVTTPPTAGKDGRVISVFGVVRIPKTKFEVLGRFDSTDPNTDAANDRLDRIVAGASYRWSGNLRATVDIDHLTYQGGTPTPALEAARSQLLFQLQVSF
jgi:hypothetical protein